MNDAMNNRLGWMPDDALEVPEARHAIMLFADGMLRAHSQSVSRDEAERQAAALSGPRSISRSAAESRNPAETPWLQTLIEFVDGFAFLVAAGPGAYLAVSASEKVDMEAVTLEAARIGGPASRADGSGPAALSSVAAAPPRLLPPPCRTRPSARSLAHPAYPRGLLRMHKLVDRLGKELTSSPRQDTGSPA